MFFYFLFLTIYGSLVGTYLPNIPTFHEFFANHEIPLIQGPERLCLLTDRVDGTFQGPIDPSLDNFSWEIYNPAGLLIHKFSSPTDPEMTFSFLEIGWYRIELDIYRNNTLIGSGTKELQVIEGAESQLKPTYFLCDDQPLELSAIPQDSPSFIEYKFEWKNEKGDLISTRNKLSLSQEGTYFARWYLTDSKGSIECDQQVEILVKALPKSVSTEALLVEQTCAGEQWYQVQLEDHDPALFIIEWLSESGQLLQSGRDFVTTEFGKFILSLRAKDLPSCMIDQRTIEIPQFIETSISIQVDHSCAEATLTATHEPQNARIEAYRWDYYNEETGEFEEIPTENSPILTISKSGTYQVTLNRLLEPNMESCESKSSLEVELPELPEFSIPPHLYLCNTSDLLPETAQELIFTLTLPDGSTATFPSGTAFPITEAGAYSITGEFPNSPDNCPSTKNFSVTKVTQASFSIADELQICTSGSILPETTQELIFTLTLPDGSTATFPSGTAFPITQAGAYSITGEFPNSPENCPSTKNFSVTKVTQAAFSIPDELQICTSGSILPETTQELIFTLTLPDGSTATFPSGTAFPITQVGAYSITGEFPNSPDNCPSTKSFSVTKVTQASFSIADEYQICTSGSILPETVQELTFTLTLPDGSTANFPSGTAFPITQAGAYSITGEFPNSPENCPSTKNFSVTKVTQAAFSIPDELQICTSGSILPETAQELIFTLTLPDGSTANFPSGTAFPITQAGAYSITGEFPNSPDNCPSTKSFSVTKVTQASFSIAEEYQICTSGSILPETAQELIFTLTLPDGSTATFPSGTAFPITQAGAYSITGDFPDSSDSCPSTKDFDVKHSEPISFSIPSEITTCGNFGLIPETMENLSFEITDPEGKISIHTGSTPIPLAKSGSYLIRGFESATNATKCTLEKKIEVNILPPPIFSPIVLEENCDGGRIYGVSLQNYTVEEVAIHWKNSSGIKIGEGETIQIQTEGNYILEIRPLEADNCPPKSISIAHNPRVQKFIPELTAPPFCPADEWIPLSLLAAPDSLYSIEWWFEDPNGTRIIVHDQKNQLEIQAGQDGLYGVQIFSRNGCLLGEDQRLILKSQDTVRPEVSKSYPLCRSQQIYPNINPGKFKSYEWIFAGQVVSRQELFEPHELGVYEVFVTSEEGCVYGVSFETYEECELQMRIPTGLVPGDPNKSFKLFPNFLVEEAEVWIFNSWGELIFHCKPEDPLDPAGFCEWNGTFQGKKVRSGTYPIRVLLQNKRTGQEKSVTTHILVLN